MTNAQQQDENNIYLGSDYEQCAGAGHVAVFDVQELVHLGRVPRYLIKSQGVQRRLGRMGVMVSDGCVSC